MYTTYTSQHAANATTPTYTVEQTLPNPQTNPQRIGCSLCVTWVRAIDKLLLHNHMDLSTIDEDQSVTKVEPTVWRDI